MKLVFNENGESRLPVEAWLNGTDLIAMGVEELKVIYKAQREPTVSLLLSGEVRIYYDAARYMTRPRPDSENCGAVIDIFVKKGSAVLGFFSTSADVEEITISYWSFSQSVPIVFDPGFIQHIEMSIGPADTPKIRLEIPLTESISSEIKAVPSVVAA